MEKEIKELVDYIEKKIAPFIVSKHAKNNLKLLISKYSLDLLYECIDISFAKYLSYINNVPTRDSVNEAINKIGGIAYNLSLPPIEKEISHICNKGSSKFYYWKAEKAKQLLHSYVKALSNHWSEDDILEDLQKEVMDLFASHTNWTSWSSQVEKWIEDINNWSNPIIIQSNDSILPSSLFIKAPRNLISLQKQINASYENNLFDCTAVMMRRLMEILLIYSYKNCRIESVIKNGDYYFNLDKILNDAETNSILDLSTNTKKDMRKIKDLGNLSAHRILFNSTKEDIDGIKLKYRSIVEELLYKAGLL